MQVRYDQKMAKYGRVAERSSLRLTPAVFSHAGQTHGVFKTLIKEQIRHKLISFEEEVRSSKVRSVMKWWSRRISMAIAKAASRNVAFKAARVRECAMEGQDGLMTRKSDSMEGGLEDDNKAVLDDLGCNADLCIANQDVVYD